MATGTRIRADLQSGTLGAALTNVETTITFAAAPGFATLAAGEYLALTLNDVEIVHLTAYTAAATTGTIERGQEGTAGVAHDNGLGWSHGPTAQDFNVQEMTDYDDVVAQMIAFGG